MRFGDEAAEGAGPSTEKEQCGDTADHDHVAVLGHEEHGEFHGAVFGVVAAGEFGLRFWKIEGRAVGFGVRSHEIDEEGKDLPAAEDVPTEDAVGSLNIDDIGEGERLRTKYNADKREAEGEFVADHLCRGAKSSEQGVLVIRRPAGERDSVDADRCDAEDDEEADVEVGYLEELDAMEGQRRAERHDGNRHERAAKGDKRSQKKQWLIDVSGDDVFFEEELKTVDEWLHHAEGADAAGSPAILDTSYEFALQQHRVGDRCQKDDGYHDDFHDAYQQKQPDVQDLNLRGSSPMDSVAVMYGLTPIPFKALSLLRFL